MKRIIIILLTSLLTVASLFAQATQKGLIQEYNEKSKKTPLAGVELNVRSANSTVSDKDGNFTLQFLTLKPGEKVNIRRIEKLGYEIFNKEAVEQWNINPTTPFVIVMCRSDKFKKIRDNYEKVSSASYARQLKQEEAALMRQKEEGKLKEEEYQKQLLNLRENHEKQLDNLDNYVDRFARIDLSILSSIENEIISLIQDGRIDEAIDKYEQQNYVNKFTAEVAEIKKISDAIDQLSDVKISKEASRDSILAAIDRQIETLKLAGGKQNFDRIGEILSEVVASDDQNKELLWKYIRFLDSQSMVADLEKNLQSYLTLSLSDEERLEALRLMVKSKINAVKYDEADSIISDITATLSDRDNLKLTNAEVSNVYFTIGGLFMDSNHPERAETYMRKAVEILPYQGPKMEIEDLEVFLKSNIGLGYMALENDDMELFRQHKDSVFVIVDSLLQDGYAFDAYPDILKCFVDLGQLEELDNEFEKAQKLFDYAQSKYYPLVASNPIRFKPAYLNLLLAKAILYQKMGEYKESEKTYLEALDCVKEIQHKSLRRYLLTKKLIYNNLSTLYLKTGETQQAVDAAKAAYDIILNYYSETPYYYESMFKSANTALARVYEAIEDFDAAEKYYLIAQDLNKKIFEERGDSYTESYWINTLDIALLYANLEHEEMGIPYYEELVEIGSQSINEGNRLFDALQSMKFLLASGYRKKGDYNKAESAIDDYLRVYPERPNGLMECARIKAYLGKANEARDYVDRAIQYNPDALSQISETDIIWTIYSKK